MLNFDRYALYDRARTMRLTLEPMTLANVLEDLPGEIVVTSPVLAAMLGIDRSPEDIMRVRWNDIKDLDEESGFRIWLNPIASQDGRTVFISAPDALPDVDDAPDWGIESAGFIIGNTTGILDWITELTGVQSSEAARIELTKMLSGTFEPPHAAVLTDTATGNTIMRWPIQSGNPIRALTLATAQWPELRYTEEDFRFELKNDVAAV